MSREHWNLDYGPFRGFYRDRENGWIFGVCSGIADRFNFHTGTVRLIAVIALLMTFWLAVVVYIGAAILIKEKPLVYSGRASENEFWRRYSRDHWRHS